MIPVVGIPFLNRPDLMRRAVESIDYPIKQLVIINNSGDHEYVPVNKNVKSVFVLRMPSNLGVSTSWNLIIKSTPHSDGWLLFNSDAWFEPGQLGVFLADCTPDKITLAGTPGWCCAHVGRGVVAKVGLFCEQFHPAYFEDWDYERRARDLGIDVYLSSAVVGHDQSSTVKSDPTFFDPVYRHRFSAGKKLFEQRRQDGATDTEWDLTRRCRLGWDT